MKNRPHLLIIWLFLFVGWLAGCNLRMEQSTTLLSTLDSCHVAFEEFAYRSSSETIDALLPPSDPWELVSPLPSNWYRGRGDDPFAWRPVLATQATSGTDVWVQTRRTRQNEPRDTLIYNTAQNTWTTISGPEGHPELEIVEFVQVGDGSIWGLNWPTEIGHSTVSFPALSQFEDATMQFQIVSESPRLELTERKLGYRFQLLNDGDIVWINVEDNPLLAYNTTNQETEIHDLFADIPYQEVVIGEDGNLNFSIRDVEAMTRSPLPQHYMQGMLFQYNPNGQQLNQLDVPEPAWPFYTNLGVAESNRLWLGAIGYGALSSGEWHLVHPNLSYFTSDTSFMFWPSSPRLLVEDNNGIAWFGVDNEFKRGIAWYDYENGKGCLTTNMTGELHEDDAGGLWLLAYGSIYAYRP